MKIVLMGFTIDRLTDEELTKLDLLERAAREGSLAPARRHRNRIEEEFVLTTLEGDEVARTKSERTALLLRAALDALPRLLCAERSAREKARAALGGLARNMTSGQVIEELAQERDLLRRELLNAQALGDAPGVEGPRLEERRRAPL